MKTPHHQKSRAISALLRAMKNAFAVAGVVATASALIDKTHPQTELLHLLAAIGLIAVCAMLALAALVFMQLITNDKMHPRKPWWWRF